MPRGGPREGAGRKPGVPNKITAEMRAEIAAAGETPLEYMLRVMRDPTAEHSRRDDMAAKAAPFIHPRLAATEITGKDGGPVEVLGVSDTEAAREVSFLLARGLKNKTSERTRH